MDHFLPSAPSSRRPSGTSLSSSFLSERDRTPAEPSTLMEMRTSQNTGVWSTRSSTSVFINTHHGSVSALVESETRLSVIDRRRRSYRDASEPHSTAHTNRKTHIKYPALNSYNSSTSLSSCQKHDWSLHHNAFYSVILAVVRSRLQLRCVFTPEARLQDFTEDYRRFNSGVLNPESRSGFQSKSITFSH